ncbi:NAD(P)-dependent dehydrogenase (short-subunit alcohol dehydrogenase family) [Filimonas zeae]|uniref:Oxidoreductase n=1 Tax=Filimonas zeae TaxID=1737353 RepID=A0A917IT96_9BACT|nr:SDR family oxidoreductase [Filimonas zeae]MDR6339539.1 NAD(P)-dependent dehydrogenase (short-subunit alcohol dehydrogenase family) [Filimonas zeae]GGH63151.1 oxidoreductase [Filimonas zeae]
MKKEFTKEEWDACIKVLQVLSRDPDQAPDDLRLKGLVTRLHRRAKKDNKERVAEAEQQKLVYTVQNLSLQKVQKLSQQQDVLRQYDKKVLLPQTQLYRKYEQPDSSGAAGATPLLQLYRFQKCYSCKTPYKEVHFFYHLLCPTCAAFNYSRRNQRADLAGRVALITGGRIKIGYLTALRMLRDGATVWVTTRFAKDAVTRFGQEPDFAEWGHRLKVAALDFRNLGQVNSFIQYFQTQQPHLDILINNAAQTVRRPPAFYRHLLEETDYTPLPEALKACLVLEQSYRFVTGGWEKQLSLPETEALFPANRFDKDHQQIDLRPDNSWTQLLQHIDTVEMLETQLVNVTVPFMLNSQLRPMLQRSPFDRKFIINVSAMEGQFNRSSKTPFHPHTNMAKAALNMMTRTAAQEYALDQIFMNSVDTGWITQENPHPKKERLYEEEAFVPPLDETDGMARIYDPVVQGLTRPELPLFGHFLKDYLPHAW